MSVDKQLLYAVCFHSLSTLMQSMKPLHIPYEETHGHRRSVSSADFTKDFAAGTEQQAYITHFTASYGRFSTNHLLSRFFLPHWICTVWWTVLLGTSPQQSPPWVLAPFSCSFLSNPMIPSPPFFAGHLALLHLLPWIAHLSSSLESTQNVSSS